MNKEKLIGELETGYVSKVVNGYCKQILEKIDSVKQGTDLVTRMELDNFYNYISNDKESMRRLEVEAELYKEGLRLSEYVAQVAIITIYKTFVEKLDMRINEENEPYTEDYEAINYLNEVYTHPHDFCIKHIDEWVESYIHYDFFTILGMRIEYSAEKTDDGEWINKPTFIITLKGQQGMSSYYELELFDTVCGCDEYFTDEYGYCNLRIISKPNITMPIKDKKMIKLPRFVGEKDIRTLVTNECVDLFDFYGDKIVIEDVFEATSTGGDSYYPMGYVEVNTDLFKKANARQKDKRVVWIFKGESATGKTYLSNLIRLASKSVYETDDNNELPKELTEDIIVIGNKYNFSVEDVKEKIVGDAEIIVVDFEYYTTN